MSVSEILHQIEALPDAERLQLIDKLVELKASDIPASLRESMSQAEGGNLIDLDDTLPELDR